MEIVPNSLKKSYYFFFLKHGIVKTDPRIDDTLKKLNELDIEHPFMDLDQFIECIEPSIVLIDKVLSGQLIIPDFKDFTYSILDIYQKISKITDGHVADYIPQLARIDPGQMWNKYINNRWSTVFNWGCE